MAPVCAAVSGWVTERQDFIKPWQESGLIGEAFALVWESADLLALNQAISKFMTQQAASVSHLSGLLICRLERCGQGV